MFENIYLENYSALVNYVSKIVGNEIIAEDIVQELFIDLWQKTKFENVGNLQAYLMRAAKFRSIDFIRKNKSKGNVVSFEDYLHEEIDESSSDISEEDIEPMLVFLFAKLSPKTRQAFELSRVDGLSYKEIASLQGVSTKTIENQIGAALKIMREQVKSWYISIFL